MKKSLLLLLIVLVAPIAISDDGTVWKDGDGNPVPDSESQKSRDDFGGMLLVTPDPDWEEKWNTPPEVGPNFGSTSTVKTGETVTILIFFVNPAVDEQGEALVLCNFRMTRPDGSISVNEENVECYRGPIQPEYQYHVRLAAPILGFVGEPGDPPGEWKTAVKLIDTHRNVSLDLAIQFTLVAGEM